MWMFKPFSGKEQTGLEGRVIEIGNEKIRVQNVIAEGGFSCVYLANDATNISMQYALKHVICQDVESLDLAMKEIQVMKLLKGNPNVVTLIAHSIVDMGRRKEVLLLLEFCENALVSVLESRGAGYFEEKQVLSIFRDVCNAVFAMHSHSPPIAHRDLKVENVLYGSEGAWKLCDFGSTSTNHKCFDRPEEMGIEEDNIRKHTTPAYRAPEMWDLYRRELISEKVDIWALGCLLYRICFLKLAFDGESKLQILNGNFRIPDLPKYSPSIIGLIKDMLQGSPTARPDITQVWFRVNELLPEELQKHLPDSNEAALPVSLNLDLFNQGNPNRTHVKPTRSPPPPPTLKEKGGNISSPPHDEFQKKPQGSPSLTPMGAFWSTQFAQDSQNKGSLFDEETIIRASKNNSQINQGRTEHQAHAFDNSFIADFDSNKLISSNPALNISKNKSREEELVAEVEKLKAQLKQSNLDKAEATSKYEKLTSICRSQRHEIQELKLALTASTLPSGFSVKNLEPGSQVFADESMGSKTRQSKSVRTNNGRPNSSKQRDSNPAGAEWGFGYGSFSASPSSETSKSPALGNLQRVAGTNAKKVESNQPAGWAGF